MVNYKVLDEIKPRGTDSLCVAAPFDEGKIFLAKKGYKIISAEENARLRMQEGKDAYVSKNGNWTREGVLYVPKKGVFLVKNSPIMANAKEATQCHRDGNEYFLTDKQVEEALADSVALSGESIPTNRLGENPISVYAFGASTKQYGEFLKQAGINEMPVWLASVQDKAFARQLWLFRLDCVVRSGLNGHNGNLNADGRVRGVCDSAEGTAQNSEVYTPAQIFKTLKNLGIGGLEQNIITDLRK